MPPRLLLALGIALGLAGCGQAEEVDAGALDGGTPPPMDASEPPGDRTTPPVDAPPVDAPPVDAPPLDAPPVDAAEPTPDAPIACPAGRTMCGTACVDTQTDVAHCGDCVTACPSVAGGVTSCMGGSCALSCDTDRQDCDGDATNGCEADITSDVAHCGDCGIPCPPAAGLPGACVDRVCGVECPAGTGDCDGSPFNGCETDTASDAESCGGCGIRCAAQETCREGACVHPGYAWSRRLGGDGLDWALGVDADAAGNAYVGGAFVPPVDFGGGPIGSSSSALYLASYDPAGAHRWSRELASTPPSGEYGLSGVAAGSADVFAAGRLRVGARAVWLASYDAATGTPGWLRDTDTTEATRVRATGVAVDGSDHVLVTGTFRATHDFGGGPLVPDTHGGYQPGVFVASYDGATGAHQWSRQLTAVTSSAITVDDAGNVTVAGTATYYLDVGAGPIAGTSGDRLWVASYDASGAYRWSRVIAGGTLGGLTTNGTDAVYLSGSYSSSSFDPGGGALAWVGGSDLFLVGFASADGAHRWSRGIGQRGSERGGQVVVNRSTGVLTVTGTFDTYTDFGGGDLGACCLRFGVSYTDAFLASYDAADGAYVWSGRYGGERDDRSAALASRSGRLYFAGHLSSSITFDVYHASRGGLDGFVAVVDPAP